MTTGTYPLILASASPRRKDLLKQINIVPDHIIPADINEDPKDGEQPRNHALRLAREKSKAIHTKHPESYVLAADTVVGVGRRILPKAETREQAKYCLELMSGRAHRVYTGVALIDPTGIMRDRVVETRLKFKKLSDQELAAYLDGKEWHGKAGGYGIQGYAECFIHHVSGSYSNVVGLPLYETRHLLIGAGVLSL